MRQSKTLAKVRAGRPVRICSLGHFNPSYVRHAAHFGFDCIWLDLEHRRINDSDVQSLLAHFHLFDIDCMVRAPTLEKTGLYRYLEDGASGLMIPHVSTEQRARELAQAVKFPPIGDRGLDGAGLDSDYTYQGGEAFTEEANRETFLVVQIETPQAVENVDAIAAVEGVDALFIGPGDLGLRLRKTPGVDLTLDDAIKRVGDAASRHGKFWGLPAASVEYVQQYHDLGAQLVAYGGDFRFLMQMLERSAAELESVYGKEER